MDHEMVMPAVPVDVYRVLARAGAVPTTVTGASREGWDARYERDLRTTVTSASREDRGARYERVLRIVSKMLADAHSAQILQVYVDRTSTRPTESVDRFFLFGEDATPEVIRFSETWDLWEALRVASSLTQKHFKSVWNEMFTIDEDHDTGEEWITLRFMTAGEPAAVANAHRDYSLEWVDRIEWDKRQRIRLSYDVV